MTVPDLSDSSRFPPFLELPEDHGAAPSAPSAPGGGDVTVERYLLAQIKENMTITKPTLVMTDRYGYPFALVFDGVGHDGLDLTKLGLKVGATAVIRGARQNVPAAAAANLASSPETITSKAAKRSFLRIPLGQAHTVQAVPAPLEQTIAAAAKLRQQQQDRGKAGHQQRCASCGAGADAKKLLKCTGCAQAWYCDRPCQTKGWSDGHKGECKAWRALTTIWGE